ncbi:MAG: hypothetical protein WCK78_12260 [Paludibacter sp.]
MESYRQSLPSFSATITIGLQKEYIDIVVDKSVVISQLQSYQEKLIKEKDIKLSASVTECSIVLNGQNEPHLRLGFINYPKFPLDIIVLKDEIENLAKYLMEVCEQNRVVVEFMDETVMFEFSEKTDPRILRNEKP